MRARWVSHNPTPELPVVAQTIVAHWLPGKYYFVSTVHIDPARPLSLLTRSLETGESWENITPGPDKFVTQAFKCDKNLNLKSYALYEREYSDLAQAKLGHKEIVDLLAESRLKLQQISSKFEDIFAKSKE